MRYFMVILTAVIFIAALPLQAEEVILGAVVSADADSGSLIVRVLEGAVASNNGEHTARYLTVLIEKKSFPDSLKVESVVRIWGTYIKGDVLKFQAVKISSERVRDDDPTGVRFRLRRGADRMPPPKGRPR